MPIYLFMMYKKQLDPNEKNSGSVCSNSSPVSQICFFFPRRVPNKLHVCDRVKITLFDITDLLLSESRHISRVLLFQYTRHTIYKSASFSLFTLIKFTKADV